MLQKKLEARAKLRDHWSFIGWYTGQAEMVCMELAGGRLLWLIWLVLVLAGSCWQASLGCDPETHSISINFMKIKVVFTFLEFDSTGQTNTLARSV